MTNIKVFKNSLREIAVLYGFHTRANVNERTYVKKVIKKLIPYLHVTLTTMSLCTVTVVYGGIRNHVTNY